MGVPWALWRETRLSSTFQKVPPEDSWVTGGLTRTATQILSIDDFLLLFDCDSRLRELATVGEILCTHCFWTNFLIWMCSDYGNALPIFLSPDSKFHFQTARPYKFNHVFLAHQPYKFKVHKNGLHSEKPINLWPNIQDCSPSSPWVVYATKASPINAPVHQQEIVLNCKFSGKGKNERNCKWIVSNNFTFALSLVAVSFNHVFREANFVLRMCMAWYT